MAGWKVHATPLPLCERAEAWWIDETGAVDRLPLDEAQELSGSFFSTGLVDAHVHPAIGDGPSSPTALSAEGAARHCLLGRTPGSL